MNRPQTSLLTAFLLSAAVLASSAARADQSPGISTVTPVVAVPPVIPSVQTKPEAHVLKVTVIDFQGCDAEFALGKAVVFTLDKDPRPSLPTGKNLVLFLNQLLIKGLPQQWVPRDPKFLDGLKPEPDTPVFLRFQLKQTKDNQDAWSQLLGRKSLSPHRTQECDCGNDEKTSFTLGVEDGSWFASTNPQIKCLGFFPTPWIAGIVFIVAGLIALVTIALGIKSSMLRDSGDPRTDGKLGTFSLARFQMALWFVTVVLASLFIFGVTGDVPAIPQGTLILMGIGAGTALGAAAIDLNKRTASGQDLANLNAESATLPQQIDDLTKRIAAAQAGDPNLPLWQKQLLDAKQRQLVVVDLLKAIPSTQVAPTGGIIDDLLSDANGISFHRLQVLGWTLVFWVVFLQSLFGKLTMVDFDTPQLALMGVSGSTYLGFKLQEKQS
jgi:hypothetical protein